MKRREFLSLLGAATAWPFAAPAQQPAMPVIGWIGARAANESAYLVVAFRQGLKETGYVESQNVALDFHWGEGHYDRLSAYAIDLARRPVTVIVATGGDPAAQAAKAATATIPVVFVSGSDPVKVGLVASLNRPGGNITGIHLLLLGMGAKRLGVLHELMPAANPIGVLINPNFADAQTQLRDIEEASKSLGLELVVLNASTEVEINAAFKELVQRRIGAVREAPPTPLIYWGDLSVTGNGGPTTRHSAQGREHCFLIDRPSPSLDRIYQLGLWLAIFFAIFHRDFHRTNFSDSGGPFTSFNRVGFAIFATLTRVAVEIGGLCFVPRPKPLRDADGRGITHSEAL